MKANTATLGAAMLAALLTLAPFDARSQSPPQSAPVPQEQSQSTAQPTDQSTGDRLANSGDVRKSQLPDPTPQGTRPPDTMDSAAEETALWDILQGVWRAPPDLQGNPVPRPNQWASNPDNPAEPTRSEDPSSLSAHETRVP